MKINIYNKFIKMGIFVTLSFSTLSAMSFNSYNKGLYNFIYASGKIRSGDVYKLSRSYRKLPHNKQTIVVFNSGGGEMSAGIQMGNFLKQNHIGSAVVRNGMCASSCALAFLGGRDLYGKKLMILPNSSKLGYHSFYYRNQKYVTSDKIQKDLSYLMKYFNYVNAPSGLITKMLDTSSGHMYWITKSNNRFLSLKSGVSRYRFSKSSTPVYTTQTNAGVASKFAYLKSYFNTVNMVIRANNGYQSGYSVALNSNTYNTWLSNNLKYAYISKIHIYKHNIVKVKAAYMLTNGERACTNNTYKLRRSADSWKIVYKRIIPCNRHSKRVIKRVRNELP